MGSGLNFFTNAIDKTPTSIGGSFGNTTLMGSNFSIWNYQVGSPFTTPAYNVTVDWIKVYIGNTSGTNRPAKCAIYLNSDKSLVTNGTSVEVTVPNGTGDWVTFKFNKPKPVLAASTAYVLVVWGGGALPSAVWRIRYGASVGDTFYYKSAVYDSWPDPWVPSTLADYKVSIYAEFGWTEVDVSGDGVPVGSTGVILDIHNTNVGLVYMADVRKNDATDLDDYGTGRFSALNHRYIIVELDANRKFEAKIQSSSVQIWLVGYTDESVVFLADRVDVTTGIFDAWTDTDVSPYVSNATGVLLKAIGDPAGAKRVSVRKNGSTDDRSLYDAVGGYEWKCMLIGVDGSNVFEQYVELSVAKIYLIGYTKAPITFFTNGVDKSLIVTGSWIDIDLTLDTEVSADGAIWQIYDTLGLSEIGEFRKDGSADVRQASARTRSQGYAMVGLDVANVCEGYIDSTRVDFYLIGYCKPYVAPPKVKAGLHPSKVLPIIIDE